MPHSFSHLLVTVLMLIAFVGQTFVSPAVACEMSADSHESHMNMNMNMDMDHSAMAHHEGMQHGAMHMSSNAQSEDCCGADCVCPVDACTSTQILYSSLASIDVQICSEAVVVDLSNKPNSISTSLYRPPIFA